MDKDRINGAANQAKGGIKEAAGKMTGDTKLQTEGVLVKAKGHVRARSAEQKDRFARSSSSHRVIERRPGRKICRVFFVSIILQYSGLNSSDVFCFLAFLAGEFLLLVSKAAKS